MKAPCEYCERAVEVGPDNLTIVRYANAPDTQMDQIRVVCPEEIHSDTKRITMVPIDRRNIALVNVLLTMGIKVDVVDASICHDDLLDQRFIQASWGELTADQVLDIGSQLDKDPASFDAERAALSQINLH